jgi:peptidoglycan/LPS O-acetylase OafA/YrhL
LDKDGGRYRALDGLRGIAAIAVAAYDLSALTGVRHGLTGFFSHGYLAADFFFCLSGFVLARAFAERYYWQPVLRFCTARAVRLLPLVAVTTVMTFGLRLVLVTSGAPIGDDTTAKLLTDLAFGVVSVPEYVHNHSQATLFPLYACAWFVGIELMISCVWRGILARAWIGTILAIPAFCLVILVHAAEQTASIDFGPMRDTSLWLPFVRGAVSFLLGVALWRASLAHVDEIFYFEPVATLLWIALWLPIEQSWAFDTVMITLVFPTMILFAAQARTLVTGTAVLSFLGDMSFPLFVIHAPLLILTVTLADGLFTLTALSMPIILATWVAAAWLVHRYVDLPMRERLLRSLAAYH